MKDTHIFNLSWQKELFVAERAKKRIDLAAALPYGIVGPAAIVRILTAAAPSAHLYKRACKLLTDNTRVPQQYCKQYQEGFDNCLVFATLLSIVDEETAEALLAELYGMEN